MNQIISSETSTALSSDTELVRGYLDRAVRPAVLDEEAKKAYKTKIKQPMQQKNARLVAHYYTDAVLQDLAEESGGFVGDSLEMARFGRDCDAETFWDDSGVVSISMNLEAGIIEFRVNRVLP